MKATAMPVVALVLFAVFGALGFGWRSWEQLTVHGDAYRDNLGDVGRFVPGVGRSHIPR
jgi:hypothetical protein